MTFRVILSQAVEDAIDSQVGSLKEHGASGARLTRWLMGLFDLIDWLYEWPRRYPIAEAVTAAKGYEARRANDGDYAIFFRVDDQRQLVEVIAFRHGRQRPWLEEEGR